MKKRLILVLMLLTTTITFSQKNLFDNISTDHQYTEYSSVKKSGRGGKYIIKNKYAIVKFHKEFLPTGEGSKIKIVVDNEGKHKGKTRFLLDVTKESVVCNGQPYESVLAVSKGYECFIAIDDYVFVVYGAGDDGESFTKIDRVFIKNGTSDSKSKGNKKKKKFSLKGKLSALRGIRSGGAFLGPEHRELQSKNIDKLITNYLVAMKAKQNARTTVELKSEKNIKKAKNEKAVRDKEAEDKEWAEAKRYNDSVKATPEYKDLQRRIKQNEANYQSARRRDNVTLRNNSSSTVYVGKSGSKNRGTEVPAGGTAEWYCQNDAYIQSHTKKGGSNSYRSTSRKVYRANTGCGKTININ